MRILLLCLWFSFGANNLFAINGQAQKLDSLNWSVSLLGGASNLSVKGFNSGEEKSTTGFGAIRITRKFESLIDLQLQVGLGSIRLNKNKTIGANSIPVLTYGTGLVLNITQTRFQPYFDFGFGGVSYGRGTKTTSSSSVQQQLEDQRGMYWQLGIGFKILNTKGFGILVETKYQNFTYPTNPQLNITIDHLEGFNFGIGLTKLF